MPWMVILMPPRDIRVSHSEWGKTRAWFSLAVDRLVNAKVGDARGINVLRQPDGQFRVTVISQTEGQCAHAAVVFLDRGELLELRDALAVLAGAEVRT